MTRKKTQPSFEDSPDKDPVEDIRVLGLICADVGRITEIVKNLANSGERYSSDLRLALGAAVRLKGRLRRLIESAEQER